MIVNVHKALSVPLYDQTMLGYIDKRISSWKDIVNLNAVNDISEISLHCIEWNPQVVNTLEVKSCLTSTPHGGPDFFLHCLSNFISLKVNDLQLILG